MTGLTASVQSESLGTAPRSTGPSWEYYWIINHFAPKSFRRGFASKTITDGYQFYLETVELIEPAFNRHIANEVKYVIIILGEWGVKFEHLLAREWVVHVPNHVTIRQRQTCGKEIKSDNRQWPMRWMGGGGRMLNGGKVDPQLHGCKGRRMWSNEPNQCFP